MPLKTLKSIILLDTTFVAFDKTLKVFKTVVKSICP